MYAPEGAHSPLAHSSPGVTPASTNALDIVVVTLIGAGGAAMLMGNIVILCNRHYRPIKWKSVPLTLLSSLGGLIWIISVLVANDHFERRKNSGLDVCVLWTYWLQVGGFSLWLNCLTLRLFALYRTFISRRDTHTYYPFLIPLLLPAVAFCIAAFRWGELKFMEPPIPSPSPSPSSSPSRGKDASGDCQFQHNARMAYGLIALLVIYFLLFLGFAFKLRNAMAQFNEFRLIRRGGILSLFLFLLSLVTIQTRAYYRPVGRCLLSAAVASAVFYYFWARNGDVVYNVLFNQTEYLDKFNKDLKRSPSQHERFCGGNFMLFTIVGCFSFREKSSAGFLKMETQLRDVRAEVERHQAKMEQLEDEVKALELEYAAMQQMTSPNSSPNAREIISKDSC